MGWGQLRREGDTAYFACSDCHGLILSLARQIGRLNMTATTQLDMNKYRQLVAIRYLNSSEDICKGLHQQSGVNDFHVLISMRSFIEYTRRGIWFLAWATDNQLAKAENPTFMEAGSPDLKTMDAMINDALGLGKQSPLMNILPGINEPYLKCLHALTHGNPISVRMSAIGLHKLFDLKNMLIRADMELNIFRILLYRKMLGEDLKDIWQMLATINNKPIEVLANVTIAAHALKQAGLASATFDSDTK